MTEGSALKAMVSFFTIWQQDITAEDMDAMERKFHLAPVAGALLGVAVMVVGLVLTAMGVNGVMSSSLVMAALVLATVFVGSRFLHFDGLADFGDGMVVSGTREDHVRALKDTLVGAGGLGVAVTVVLISFSEYAYAGYAAILMFAPATEVLVKNSQVAAAAFGKPGNGMAGRQVSETNPASVRASTVIALVLALVFGLAGVLLTDAVFGFGLSDAWAAVLAIVVGVAGSVLVGYLMASKSNAVFGMVNGDILGATNEISRAAVMFLMLLVYSLVA